MFKQKIILTKEECNELIELCNSFNPSPVYNKDSGVYVKNDRRNSEQSKFTNLDKVKKILLPKLVEFNISDLPDSTHMIRYKKGCFFKEHRDRGDGLEHRSLTLIVQLSDSKDYEGADLIINKRRVSKDIGNLILFDSGLLHEVTELTKGERNVLVSWITNNEISKKKTYI